MNKKPKRQAPQESYSKSNTIVDIHQLSENAIENTLKTDLLRNEEKCVALSQSIDQLLHKLQEKEDEILHLKQMLFASVPVVGEASPLVITDEEYIALQQLQKLKDNARLRELTLDEIKKFDLLVKNKRLAQGNATTINTDKFDKNTSKEKLLQIASKKTSNQGEQ